LISTARQNTKSKLFPRGLRKTTNTHCKTVIVLKLRKLIEVCDRDRIYIYIYVRYTLYTLYIRPKRFIHIWLSVICILHYNLVYITSST
jgi:hypothetical protein